VSIDTCLQYTLRNPKDRKKLDSIMQDNIGTFDWLAGRRRELFRLHWNEL
jgi:hypothetical protein